MWAAWRPSRPSHQLLPGDPGQRRGILSGAKGEIAVKVFGPNLRCSKPRAARSPASSTASRARPTGRAAGWAARARWDIRLRREASGLLRDDQRHRRERRDDPDRPRRRRGQCLLRGRAPLPTSPCASAPVPRPLGRHRQPAGGAARRARQHSAGRPGRHWGCARAPAHPARSRQPQCHQRPTCAAATRGSFVAEAQKRSPPVSLLAGYTITWGGQFENQQRAMAASRLIVPITLGLIFSLLFWAFRDIRPALLVLVDGALRLIGGFAGLGLARTNLSVSAAVGLHRGGRHLRLQNGADHGRQVIEIARRGARDAFEAILDGAMLRLRPIVMTALMAGLGLLPAALSTASNRTSPSCRRDRWRHRQRDGVHPAPAAGAAVLRRRQAASEERTSPQPNRPGPPPMRILIVEDDPLLPTAMAILAAGPVSTADFVGSAELAEAAVAAEVRPDGARHRLARHGRAGLLVSPAGPPQPRSTCSCSPPGTPERAGARPQPGRRRPLHQALRGGGASPGSMPWCAAAVARAVSAASSAPGTGRGSHRACLRPALGNALARMGDPPVPPRQPGARAPARSASSPPCAAGTGRERNAVEMPSRLRASRARRHPHPHRTRPGLHARRPAP